MKAARISSARTQAVLGALAILAVAGCSSSHKESGSVSPTPSSTTVAGALGSTPVVALSSKQVCDIITPSILGKALGIKVEAGTPSTAATPQCTYAYSTSASSAATITVASQRAADLGERAGDAAFDYILTLNENLASGTKAVPVSTGGATRGAVLSGDSLRLGVAFANGHLLTVIVPSEGAKEDRVAELVQAIVTALKP